MSSTTCSYLDALVADNAYVYWSCEGERTLHWMSQSGAAAHEEHVQHNAGGHIATWEGFAYVADPYGGRVLRIRPREATVEVLRTGFDRLSRIAVDDSGIYVAYGPSIRHLSF